MDESAVSESIGFIIIFSIVVAGIGLVSLYGYPMLLQHQIGADERTMEQTMITIQNDIKLLTYSNVPYKDTALRVSGGALTVHKKADSSQKFNFEWWDNGTWEDLHADFINFKPGELRYVSDQGTAVISFENGAVVKRQQDASGSVMLAEPRWFYDDDTDTLVIFLMRLDSSRALSLNGIGNLQMSRNENSLLARTIEFVDPTHVAVTYDPDTVNDYSQAWKNYFSGSSIAPNGLGPHNGKEYTISNVKRVFVKQYDITITNI
ncbi:MAG TPA: hypothetical protein ENN85_02980 [Methanoculleus sp.]|nr:hypothetical protein [Methanoculleus sp.]